MGKHPVMAIVLPGLLVLLATIGIFQLRKWTAKLDFKLLQNAEYDGLFKFQLAQLMMTTLLLAVVYGLYPSNFAAFFRLGNVNARIGPIAWLGITGKESWLQIALTLGLFITLGTGIFMVLLVRKAGATFKWIPSVLFWSIVFSAMNAFSEEAIFRIGLVAPLDGLTSPAFIALMSGILFGIPHYLGQPSGIVGMFMAGFLGWLLALSTIETRGIFIAWGIHFVQDVVIFVCMFAIGVNSNRKSAVASQT